jgi:hypothetical protein
MNDGETRLQHDRNAAVQGDGEQLCRHTAGQSAGEHQSCRESKGAGNQRFRPAGGTGGTKGRETNAPCPRETAMSMGAWETNMPERETAAVRRDKEPLTSAAQERRQRAAAA